MNKFQSRITQYANPLQFHFHPFLVADQQQFEFVPVTLQRHVNAVDDRAGRIVAAHHIHGYVDHFAGLTFWHSRYSLADDAGPFFPQNNWKISSQSPRRRHSCGMDHLFKQTKGLAKHPFTSPRCVLLLVLLERQNLSSTIHAAFLADTVRKAGGAAIRAQCDLHAFVTVGGMTRTNRTLADFTLLNCHCPVLQND